MARRRRHRRSPRPRRRRRTVLIPLASLGDIAFLVLIFLFVASELIREPTVKIDQPRSEDIEELEQRAAAVVTLDDEGRIFLNREQVEDVELLEAGVAAFIEQEDDPDQRIVTFRADKELDRSQYMPAWEALINAGARIAAVGERER